MNIEKIQALLSRSKGAKIITLTVMTPVTKDIVKVSRVNGIVNWDYASAVNRQRVREGKKADFVPSKRKWGTRLNDSPFVSHVKKDGSNHLYLEVKVERSLFCEYRNSNGQVIMVENSIRSNKETQGVEKEIILRDYDVSHILDITIDGEKYVID